MLLLKRLTLTNFLSHENTIIEFNEGEKILLDGASGAGKSTVFDGIIWALYGQGRADNRSLVRKGSKSGKVSLELRRTEDGDSKETLFIVTRSSTQNGKHSIDISIEKSDGQREALALSGVRDIQAWIDKDLIGASYLLFINSVAYVQGNSESFVTQNAAKRKELLLEIVKAEDYGIHYENARKALSNLRNEESIISGQTIELQARLGAIKCRPQDQIELVARLLDLISEEEKLKPVLADLEEQKSSLMSLKKTSEIINKRWKQLESEEAEIAASLSVKTKELNNKPSGSLEDKNKELVMFTENEATRNAYLARKPLVHNYSAEITRHTNESVVLNQKPVCPSMDNCPYHSKTIEMINANSNKLQELSELVKKEEEAMTKWLEEGKTLPAQGDIRTLMAEIKALERYDSVVMDLAVLNASLITKREEIQDIVREMSETTAKINNAGICESVLITAREQEKKLSDEISSIKNKIENMDKAEEEIKVINTKLEALKDQSAIIQIKGGKVAMVKEAFGSKGIETLVIDYLLPKLEDRINDVLSKLSDFRVRLDTQKKSADGESIIEGLFITILNEIGEEMPFENYSGGEKLKIAVSISESLATLQKVGFRLFDETFIGLDENSTESFASVLNTLNRDFSQVLCISHLLQIKELFETKINIKKTNNVSFIDKAIEPTIY